MLLLIFVNNYNIKSYFLLQAKDLYALKSYLFICIIVLNEMVGFDSYSILQFF